MNHLNMTYISRIALSQECPCHILLFAIASVHKLQPSTAKTHNQKACWGFHSRKTMWEVRNRSRLFVLSKMQIGYEICFYMISLPSEVAINEKKQCEIKFNLAGCRSYRCESLYTKQHPNNQPPHPPPLEMKIAHVQGGLKNQLEVFRSRVK